MVDISKACTVADLQTQYGTPEEPAKMFRDYKEYKMTLDIEIKGVCESFVRIGYLLKIARDTDILSESGYKNLTDFAQNEYHLTKDQVSRFIAINDRFSVGGYSEELISQYEGYGVAKLSEMLTLPDGIIEEINPDITRREIQDIKREIAAEEAVTPLEVAIEAAAPETIREEKDYSLTERIWKEFFHENRELYKALGKDLAFMAAFTEVWTKELSEKAGNALVDILAPSGDTVLWSRVSGVGKFMISIHTDDGTIVYTNIRTNEKTKGTAADAENAVHEVFGACDAHEWELVCGEEFEKPAPAPEKKPEPKPEKKDAATRQQDDSHKAATDHGIILVGAPNNIGWAILEEEPEGTKQTGKAAETEDAAGQQDKEEQEDDIRGLRNRIYDKEHEFEEVFEDAYADGFTPDGLKSIARQLHQLQVMIDKLLDYKLQHQNEESDGDDDDSI